MDALGVNSFEHLHTLKTPRVPDMDRWHGTKLSRCNQATIDIADGTRNYLLVVMGVMPLLAYSWVE